LVAVAPARIVTELREQGALAKGAYSDKPAAVTQVLESASVTIDTASRRRL
jgi:hypothetical protein